MPTSVTPVEPAHSPQQVATTENAFDGQAVYRERSLAEEKRRRRTEDDKKDFMFFSGGPFVG